MQHADNRRGAMTWWLLSLACVARGRPDYSEAAYAMDVALFKFLPEAGGHQRPWHNVHRAREVLDERPDWPGR